VKNVERLVEKNTLKVGKKNRLLYSKCSNIRRFYFRKYYF